MKFGYWNWFRYCSSHIKFRYCNWSSLKWSAHFLDQISFKKNYTGYNDGVPLVGGHIDTTALSDDTVLFGVRILTRNPHVVVVMLVDFLTFNVVCQVAAEWHVILSRGTFVTNKTPEFCFLVMVSTQLVDCLMNWTPLLGGCYSVSHSISTRSCAPHIWWRGGQQQE